MNASNYWIFLELCKLDSMGSRLFRLPGWSTRKVSTPTKHGGDFLRRGTHNAPMIQESPTRRLLARELVVGESSGPIPVLALLHWNPSRIIARPGQRFLIEADNSIWSDDKNPCTASGSSTAGLQRFTSAMCRHKQAAWMELVGTLGRDHDHQFRVGSGAVWENTTKQEGELFFYANDVYFMYYNNTGSVMVTVTRLA